MFFLLFFMSNKLPLLWIVVRLAWTVFFCKYGCLYVYICEQVHFPFLHIDQCEILFLLNVNTGQA